jgi:hypothetical protein
MTLKPLVVSYSLTGNNDALAGSIAADLGAEHYTITESKPRTMGTIILDLLLDRTPKVDPPVNKLANEDLVLLVGPVWIGQVATPLRAWLKHLKAVHGRYAFVSISGGADGPNPKLAGELLKRAGREPSALINLLIADLLPPEPKPVRKVTSAYHLSAGDVKSLTRTAVKILRETLAK